MNDGFDDAIDEAVTEPETEGRGVTLDDFVAWMPGHNFIFTPCREAWVAASINARFSRVPVIDKHGNIKRDVKGKVMTMAPSTWLSRNRPVEQMTWCPGFPMNIADRLVVNSGWIERKDVTTFNLYRPPRLALGDAAQAGPWREHLRRVYPEDAVHIELWLAQRVQRPAEKINHALVLGGEQGVGKDTLLEPVRYAVGAWNFQDVAPTHLLGNFNGFIKTVIMRVNEARDLGDIDRFSFYDRTKSYAAAPPETLRCNEKHLREYYVFNCLGLIFTTNHKTDGIYLPAGDRRHYVAWSLCKKEDFPDGYWKELWGWYQNGGIQHVAAYLSELDLSDFDVKAPPPKTPAFWDIVLANNAPENAELADLLDTLGNPEVVTLAMLIDVGEGSEAAEWLMDRRNRRAIPHRMERCGYVAVHNPRADDGLWKVKGRRQVTYARKDMESADQLAAVERLQARREK